LWTRSLLLCTLLGCQQQVRSQRASEMLLIFQTISNLLYYGGAPDSVVLLVNSLSAAVHAAGLPTTGAPPDALPKRFLFSFKKLSTLLY
jgi:hypothetical protein